MKHSPSEPYYAVIFTSMRSDTQGAEYEKAAERMVELASSQPGFLGIESVRGSDGAGITASYWKSKEDIRTWKNNAEHRETQEHGKKLWYEWFKVKICLVEREYSMGLDK